MTRASFIVLDFLQFAGVHVVELVVAHFHRTVLQGVIFAGSGVAEAFGFRPRFGLLFHDFFLNRTGIYLDEEVLLLGGARHEDISIRQVKSQHC